MAVSALAHGEASSPSCIRAYAPVAVKRPLHLRLGFNGTLAVESPRFGLQEASAPRCCECLGSYCLVMLPQNCPPCCVCTGAAASALSTSPHPFPAVLMATIAQLAVPRASRCRTAQPSSPLPRQELQLTAATIHCLSPFWWHSLCQLQSRMVPTISPPVYVYLQGGQVVVCDNKRGFYLNSARQVCLQASALLADGHQHRLPRRLLSVLPALKSAM